MKTYKLMAVLAIATLIGKTHVVAQSTPAQSQPEPQTIEHQQAPAFTLKDLSGKTVSLADYRGKVVVVDFWATWCSPCKASFPGMQKVVDHYKNDKDVVLVFIDTREKVNNYPELVTNFLASNHYTFHVLYDEKGPEGLMNKILKQYKVPGIPTKFIIDSKGMIRNEMIGFNPDMTPEQLDSEVSALIEQAKKPASGAALKAR